jgi:hypothetical protein
VVESPSSPIPEELPRISGEDGFSGSPTELLKFLHDAHFTFLKLTYPTNVGLVTDSSLTAAVTRERRISPSWSKGCPNRMSSISARRRSA